MGQLNMELLSTVPYDSDGNDVWGYNAPDGSEYAIMGTVAGVSIVNITDPRNPLEVEFIPQQPSIWRDMKTWDNYAYVVADQDGTTDGILVIDLSMLPDSISYENVNPMIEGATLNHCHNIYIDEGIAYLAGCNGESSPIIGGGVIMFDINTTPGLPILAGLCPSVYSHDVYVRDDLVYSSEIFQGAFTVYDVKDKSNVKFIATQTTPFEFTHNTWLSDDGSTIFTTDERANAPVAAYDISDVNNIKFLDEFRPKATISNGVIPHNVHVWNDWLVISYYSDGCIIVDAARPDNLIEVGNFDTATGSETGFRGAWGAFPFLNSGNVIIGDRQKGLVVLRADYVRACYLEGMVTDGVSGQTINNAQIEIMELSEIENTDLTGNYKTGTPIAGSYTVTASADGYKSITKTLELSNGNVTNGDFQLGKYEAAIISCDNSTTSEITISWIANDSATGYSVILDGSMIESIDVTSYTFSGLTLGTTYEMTIQTNFESCAPLSSTINCITLDLTAIDEDGDGFTANQDCDDNDNMIFPGNTEICDEIDNNCDGLIDEGFTLITSYPDSDGDGFGIDANAVTECEVPIGYVNNNLDCNDNDSTINPNNIEQAYNGIDDDCNPATLDDDLDRDGFPLAEDCDDDNPSVNPGAAEICNNSDENCNGMVDEGLILFNYFLDSDNDGFGDSSESISSCFQPSGYVTNDEDCNDSDSAINPSQTEIPYNGIDDDCRQETLDDDLDQDGFDLTEDCDDQNADINPDTIELPYNGIDEDCDPATPDDDLDRDGFLLAEDCDDENAEINPDATESPYNGMDEDCNPATLDDDLDQDGFLLAEDCDDENPNVNPDSIETPYNGMDDDCNAATLDDDLDQDGFLLAEDCDDENADINPNATDVPDNGIDENCNGEDATTAIYDFATAKVTLFPNPVSSKLNISVVGSVAYQVKIYDFEGLLIYTGINSRTVSVDELSTGTYLVVLRDLNSDEKVMERLVVLK